MCKMVFIVSLISSFPRGLEVAGRLTPIKTKRQTPISHPMDEHGSLVDAPLAATPQPSCLRGRRAPLELQEGCRGTRSHADGRQPPDPAVGSISGPATVQAADAKSRADRRGPRSL